MTFKEVEVACRGYELRTARALELQRFTAAILMNANRKKGTRHIRPEDIMPLATDRKHKKVELITADEFEEVKKLFSKVEWQTKN